MAGHIPVGLFLVAEDDVVEDGFRNAQKIQHLKRQLGLFVAEVRRTSLLKSATLEEMLRMLPNLSSMTTVNSSDLVVALPLKN